MGYLGRRIGLSQDNGDSNPGAAGGAVGGGLLDLFAHGYFERQGDLYNAPGTIARFGLTATGGYITDYTSGSDFYRAHIFTSSGTFNVTDDTSDFGTNVEYLVVAGGGGGGGSNAGGGGAGGLRTNLPGVQTAGGTPLTGSTFPAPATGGNGSGVYTVTVGAAGGMSRGIGPSSQRRDGNDGNDSYFGPPSTPNGITSSGGGGGGAESSPHPLGGAGHPGGSGGGAGAYNGPRVGGSGNSPPFSPIQGHDGGNAQESPERFGGGGGGAGQAGVESGPEWGTGGNGVQVAIAGPAADTTGVGALNPGPGQYQWFAGGGGGGWNPDPPSNPSQGGVGGGGAGGNGDPPNGDQIQATQGQGTTGGGGGGGTNNEPGAAGGSGIVIIRYQIGEAASTKATGGIVTQFAADSPSPMAGKTIHVFVSSGVLKNPSGSPITNADYLVVGGGGGGAGTNLSGDGAAGGGAGGLISSHPEMPGGTKGSQITIPTSDMTIVVGSGGGGAAGAAPGAPAPSGNGIPGSVSYLGIPLQASGGGGGSLGASENGQAGGSGGGSSGGGSAGDGGAGNTWTPDSPNHPGTMSNQGYAGGKGNSPPINNYGAGGGGGFTEVGESGGDGGGNGGAGISLSISGTSTGYGGGGGGGAAVPRPTVHHGTATHGGGAGATGNPGGTFASVIGQHATFSTGGGGGGGAGGPFPGMPTAEVETTYGGNGAPGIVIVAYPT